MLSVPRALMKGLRQSAQHGRGKRRKGAGPEGRKPAPPPNVLDDTIHPTLPTPQVPGGFLPPRPPQQLLTASSAPPRTTFPEERSTCAAPLLTHRRDPAWPLSSPATT